MKGARGPDCEPTCARGLWLGGHGEGGGEEGGGGGACQSQDHGGSAIWRDTGGIHGGRSLVTDVLSWMLLWLEPGAAALDARESWEWEEEGQHT